MTEVRVTGLRGHVLYLQGFIKTNLKYGTEFFSTRCNQAATDVIRTLALAHINCMRGLLLITEFNDKVLSVFQFLVLMFLL